MLQVPATHKINNFLNFLHLQSSSIILNLCTWGAFFSLYSPPFSPFSSSNSVKTLLVLSLLSSRKMISTSTTTMTKPARCHLHRRNLKKTMKKRRYKMRIEPRVGAVGANASGNLTLGIWDTRLRRRIPTVTMGWASDIRNAAGIESSGVQKVYVRDDRRYELTVGDMRNVLLPLEDLTESQLDLWWPNSCMLKI
ncbi:hypothetical protein P8452_51897 [Trifolium repens]|nr:hypothetical protein P8452_51897 [Trifolium repens]